MAPAEGAAGSAAASAAGGAAAGEAQRRFAEAGLEAGVQVWVASVDSADEAVWRAGVIVGVATGADLPAKSPTAAAKFAVGDGLEDGCAFVVELQAEPGRPPERRLVPLPASSSSAPGSPPAARRGGAAASAPKSARAAAARYLKRNVELLSDSGVLAVQDLSTLAVLHEAEVLHALQVRHHHGKVYTCTGPMLLAVNPFQDLPGLYSYDRLRAFVDLPLEEASPEPHVYGTARTAYLGVWREGRAQTVLVSGESGAGKTETTKFVMRFLALAGAPGAAEDSMSPCERRVLGSIPLLEALGNAKTLRNDNSSRFGKYIELQFGARPEVGEEGAGPVDEADSADDADSAEAAADSAAVGAGGAADGAGGEAPASPTAPAAEEASEEAAGPAPAPVAARGGPRLVGAKTHCYLLEKVRVTGPQEGERSFHIFYQILAAARGLRGGGGLPPRVASLLERLADRSPADFRCLAASSALTKGSGAGRDEAKDFATTLAALESFGVPEEQVAEVVAAVVAVMELSNISFQAPAGNSEGSEVQGRQQADGPLKTASDLLGVEAKALEATLCQRRMRVRDERASEQTIAQSRSVPQAIDGRDALARHLYGAVFAYVVARVNVVLATGGEGASTADGGRDPDAAGPNGADGLPSPFVGVLDIFGFEFFETNSFEQLCINYTNELLQQHFNEVIFNYEAALYAREQIPWDAADFPDNKAIVELLAGTGDGKRQLRVLSGVQLAGMLPMLDEECNVTSGSSEAWCRKLVAKYGKHSHFQAVKHRQGNFIVQHFAGPVEYTSEAFLTKNKDELSPDVQACLCGSSREFIRKRFSEHGRTFGVQTAATTGRVTRAKAYSVSSEFQKQLTDLMSSIRETTPHFVRCIKPNPQSVPGKFQRRSVVEQLRYQGVLEAMRVSRAGYPVRRRHREAVLDYRRMAPREIRRRLEVEISRAAWPEASRFLFDALSGLLTAAAVPEGSLQVGMTMLFLKREAAEALEAELRRTRAAAALVVQRRWRGLLCRRSYGIARCAILHMQALARGATARRICRSLRRERAAKRLQAAERGRCTRRACRAAFAAARKLQQFARTRAQRRRFLAIARATRALQQWCRRAVRSATKRRQGAAALRIQRTWRGRLGRRTAVERRAVCTRLQKACQKLAHRWRWRKLLQVRERVREQSGCRSPTARSPKAAAATPRFTTPRTAPLPTPRSADWTPPLSEASPGDPSSSDPPSPPPAPGNYGELQAASAALRRTNAALEYEAAALERMVKKLREELGTRSDASAWPAFLNMYGCCYQRDGGLGR